MYKNDFSSCHGGNILDWSEKYGFLEKDIIDFSSNVNIFSPEIDFDKVIPQVFTSINKYPDIRYRQLCQCIANQYKLEEWMVIPGNGASELIFLMTGLSSFGSIGIFQPTFSEYHRSAQIFGKNIVPLDFGIIDQINDGSYDNYEEDFKELDLVVLCNPNNPSGEIKDIKRLIQAMEKRHIFTMVDETFIDFLPNDRYSVMNLVQSLPHLCVLKAVTKYHSLTGVRLGYLFSSNQNLIDSLWQRKEPWTVNCFAEQIAIELFSLSGNNQLKEFKKKTQRYYEHELNRIKEKYATMDYVKQVSQSRANYLLIELKEKISGTLLKESLFEQKGFLIRSCIDYDGLGDSHIRIAIKNEAANDKLYDAISNLVVTKRVHNHGGL